MLVLGIDPGSVITGYGVLDYQGRKSRLVACGSLRPDPKLPFEKRLLEIYDGLLELIADVSPDEAALENTFYGVNVKTLMKMCHARGAIMLALANSDLPIYEYSPREVKKAVVGKGGASKEQVQFMVQNLFGKSKVSGSFDVSDAVAVALCHVNRIGAPGKDLAGGKNGLEAKLEAAGIKRGRKNKLSEKLLELGVGAKQAAGSKRKGRRG